MSLILPASYRRATIDHHRPQPNPVIEEKVRAELKALDDLIDIRWFENIHYNERHKAFEGRYALVVRWPSGDPRYQMIQSGEIGNDPYDIFGWFAKDVQDGGSEALDPDLMLNRAMEILNSADNTKVGWKQRLANAAAKNKALREKRKSDFIDQQVHDIASYYRNSGLNIQQISVPKEIK
jgi:hypothetical protein